MSKTWELLRRAEQERESFQRARGTAGPTNGKRPGRNTEARVHEEEIKLVQRVFLLPGPDAPRAVVFCGVEQDDRSSVVCARASEILAAQVAESVCVVDANVRSPSLSRYFGVDNHQAGAGGIVRPQCIEGSALQPPSRNLWLVTGGSLTSGPHSLLSSDRLRPLLRELRTEFSHILIDAPPVNLYGDAILLGQLTDGVILVLESNSTRRETARNAKESLEAAKVRLLGAVLNNRTFPIPEVIYSKL